MLICGGGRENRQEIMTARNRSRKGVEKSIYHPDLSPRALSGYDLEQFQSLVSRSDPKALERVAAALPASVYDPELKAFIAIISKSQQALLVELLLKVLPALPVNSQVSILDSLRDTINGYWTDFGEFTAAIALYTSSPLVDPLVLPLLRRAFFCADLLASFEQIGKAPPPDWLAVIRQRRAQSDFVESSTDLKQLDALLAAIPIPPAPGAKAERSLHRAAARILNALTDKFFKRKRSKSGAKKST
jgi:hypothetical protein